MLQIRKKYKHMRWNTLYFAGNRERQFEAASDIVEYNHLLPKTNDFFKEFPYTYEYKEDITLVTDLTQEETELFDRISKKERQKIRKAEREGIEVQYYDSSIDRETINKAIELYNRFVDTKEELHFKLSYEDIEPFLKEKAFWCTMAVQNEEVLVMRMYYADDLRVRAWRTGSLFRVKKENSSDIGRANCLLCWKDVIYFKEMGFKCYDWGGYSESSEVAGIARYKKAFGGELEKGINILTYGSIVGRIGLFYRKIRNRIR